MERSTRSHRLAFTTVLLVAGCGDVATPPGQQTTAAPARTEASGGEASGAAASPSSSPEQTSDGVRVFALVHAETSDDLANDAIRVAIDVDVYARGEPVADATVRAGALGKAEPTFAVRRGHYSLVQTGFAPWYEISVDSPEGSLTGIRLRAPRPHKVHLDGNGSKTPVTVRWSPSDDYWVDDVGVEVANAKDGTVTFVASPVTDEGALALPDDILVGPDPHAIRVRRAVSSSLATPQSVAIVEVVSTVVEVGR